MIDPEGGTVRLLIISDTHIGTGTRDLPAPLWAAVDDADVVIHAGDWISEAALDALQARAARLVGVHGNNDGDALRARLPEVARAELGGVRFAVVHETGSPTDRRRQPTHTWMTAEVIGGTLGPVTLHHLERS